MTWPGNSVSNNAYLTGLWQMPLARQGRHLALRSAHTAYLTDQAESTEVWAISHIAASLKASVAYQKRPVLLDAGCGNGHFLTSLLERPDLPTRIGIGLDRNRDSLAGFAERIENNGIGLEASVLRLPLATGSCGAAMYNRMLNQTGDIAAALAEGRRVLAADGQLFVVTADSERVSWLRQTHEILLQDLKFPAHTYTHRTPPDQRLNLQNGAEWLSQAGFVDTRLFLYERHLTFDNPANLLEYYATGLLFQRSAGLEEPGLTVERWSALYWAMMERIEQELTVQGSLTLVDGAALFVASRSEAA